MLTYLCLSNIFSYQEHIDVDERNPLSIKSPQYPSKYENNFYNQWDILVPDEFAISVIVRSIDIENGRDHLYVGDGVDDFSNQGGAWKDWTGSRQLDFLELLDFVSKGSSITVIFTTDYSTTKVGFWIQFHRVKKSKSNSLMFSWYLAQVYGTSSVRGAEVSCPDVFFIACPKIKCFCPNITLFFWPKLPFEKFGGGGGAEPPPPPPRLVRLWYDTWIFEGAGLGQRSSVPHHGHWVHYIWLEIKSFVVHYFWVVVVVESHFPWMGKTWEWALTFPHDVDFLCSSVHKMMTSTVT